MSAVGWQLIEQVRPFLERTDIAGLANHVALRWPAEHLAGLLSDGDPDVVKVAATCLGLIGSMQFNDDLAGLLAHDDPMVVAMVEHALWGIWMRAAGPRASRQLSHAIRWLNVQDYPRAIGELSNLLKRYPDFAEAYNQRAIAHYLAGEYEASLADCRQTLRRNPVHFGAQAGAAHCLAHLGRWADALEGYHRTLQLYPRLEGIRQLIRQIREGLQAAGANAGRDQVRPAGEPST